MWRIFAVLLNEERKKLIENSPGLPGKTLDLNSIFVVQIQIVFPSLENSQKGFNKPSFFGFGKG